MLYTDCPGGRTAAVACHVSFAQIAWFIQFAKEKYVQFVS